MSNAGNVSPQEPSGNILGREDRSASDSSNHSPCRRFSEKNWCTFRSIPYSPLKYPSRANGTGDRVDILLYLFSGSPGPALSPVQPIFIRPFCDIIKYTYCTYFLGYVNCSGI